MVRLGRTEKVRKEIDHVTLDSLVEKHKNFQQITNINRSIEELRGVEGKVDNSQISALLSKIKLIQNETISSIIKSTSVVCGTNASLGQNFLEHYSFPIHVLVINFYYFIFYLTLFLIFYLFFFYLFFFIFIFIFLTYILFFTILFYFYFLFIFFFNFLFF